MIDKPVVFKRCVVTDIDSGEIVGYGKVMHLTYDGFHAVKLDGDTADFHLWPSECVEYTDEEYGN